MHLFQAVFDSCSLIPCTIFVATIVGCTSCNDCNKNCARRVHFRVCYTGQRSAQFVSQRHIGLSPSCSYLSDKFCTRSTIHDRQTRYRDTLNIPSCRIAAGQRAFCYRGVKIWNSLSTDLTQITDANILKKLLIKKLVFFFCNYFILMLKNPF